MLGDVAAVLDRPDGPADLLARLGWDLPPGVDDIGLAALDFGDLVSAIENLEAPAGRRHHGRRARRRLRLGRRRAGQLPAGLDTVVNAFAATGNYLTQTDHGRPVRAAAAGLLRRLGAAHGVACSRSAC